jgi:hypothetical protein
VSTGVAQFHPGIVREMQCFQNSYALLDLSVLQRMSSETLASFHLLLALFPLQPCEVIDLHPAVNLCFPLIACLLPLLGV